MPRVPRKEIEKDLERYTKFSALANSEGGIELQKLCLADMVSAIDTLASGFRELSHTEMIALCASLKERLSLYRLFVNAPKNVEMTQQALKEALAEDDD